MIGAVFVMLILNDCTVVKLSYPTAVMLTTMLATVVVEMSR